MSQIVDRLMQGEEVPFDEMRPLKLCTFCAGRLGNRISVEEPHLVCVTTGTVHGYGEWSDITHCGRDCTGRTWAHRV